MRAALRQTLALGQLIVRYWARAGIPHPARKDTGRRVSGALPRLAFLMLFVHWGFRVGSACADKVGTRREAAVVWILIGVFGASVIGSAQGRLPGVRAVAPPTAAPILEPLPLGLTSRTVIGLLERLALYTLSVAALVAALPEAKGRAAILAFSTSTAALLTGDALLRVARVFVSPMRLARFGVAVVFFQLPLLLLLAGAAGLSSLPSATHAIAFLLPTARVFLHGEGVPVFVAVLAGVAVVAAFVIRTAERIGFDRVDVVPDRRPAQVAARRLTVEGVDAVVGAREPGGRFGFPLMFLYTTIAAGGALLITRNTPLEKQPTVVPLLCRVAIFVATFGGFVLVNTRATRMIARDTVARPFLAPLPVTPADMLRGKARGLRNRALIVAMPALLLLFVPAGKDLRIEIAIRVGSMLVAVTLASGATVSVAFLTQGLGAVRSSIGSFNLETMLVAMPLFAVAAPPYSWAGGIGIVTLSLLAFEARRAAHACVRWMDDGDDFVRETPVWRALLVFAAFHAAQSLTLRAVAFADLAESTKGGIAYSAGAVILVALTLQARRGLTTSSFALRPWSAFLGIAIGAAAGGGAFLYAGLLRQMDERMPDWTIMIDAPRLLLFALLVVMPIAEEVFFRGWLQSAISEDAPTRRYLAPLVSGFAFAAVRPPLTFVPVLVLGLGAGLLFARTKSLGATILAHTVYNAFAVLAFAR